MRRVRPSSISTCAGSAAPAASCERASTDRPRSFESAPLSADGVRRSLREARSSVCSVGGKKRETEGKGCERATAMRSAAAVTCGCVK